MTQESRLDAILPSVSVTCACHNIIRAAQATSCRMPIRIYRYDSVTSSVARCSLYSHGRGFATSTLAVTVLNFSSSQ